ncbi:MAG: hypothetical protein ACLVKO_01390 [Dysgonomonas sp.]
MEKKKNLFELSNLGLEKIEDKYYVEKVIKKTDGKTLKVKSLNFGEQDTPLYLKSYLAILPGSVGNEPIVFEQDFYIGNIIKSGNLKPDKHTGYANKSGDCFLFRIEHGKNTWTTVSFLGGILLATGELILDIAAPSEEYEE